MSVALLLSFALNGSFGLASDELGHSWLACDSKAREHVLQPLLSHVSLAAKANNITYVAPRTKGRVLDPSLRSGKRIDDLGGGLFICAVSALANNELMDSLGIRAVLNCANDSLYDSFLSPDVRNRLFASCRVKVLGADDDDEQELVCIKKI